MEFLLRSHKGPGTLLKIFFKIVLAFFRLIPGVPYLVLALWRGSIRMGWDKTYPAHDAVTNGTTQRLVLRWRFDFFNLIPQEFIENTNEFSDFLYRRLAIVDYALISAY